MRPASRLLAQPGAIFFVHQRGRHKIRETATVSLNGELVGALLYADDIAVIAKDEDPLQSALDNLEEQLSILIGFKFNPAKCEVVAPDPTIVRGTSPRREQLLGHS